MKLAIIYKSFSGYTKQYARWLAEDTGGEVLTYGQATPTKLKEFDAFIVMSGTYVSFMPLVSFLKKNWESIKYKTVAVIAVGVIPPEDKGSKISYERIPAHIREKVKYWKLSGRMGGKPVTDFGPVARENLKPVIEYFSQRRDAAS